MKKMERPKSYKDMECKICGEIVEKVDLRTTAVTCNKCANKMLIGGTNPRFEE
mgnify:CR=1 FL=1|jgi:DNA-directed RNA polymerase subunit RPC12/RpoP